MKNAGKGKKPGQAGQIGEEPAHSRYILYLFLSMLGAYVPLMMFTGIWPLSSNPYNSYTLQALSWLSGRLDLGQNYSHLELAVYNGKYFVSFPPFPSVVLLPFALFFGTRTPDHLLTLISAFIGAYYAYKTAFKLGRSKEESVFWALFATIGGNFLFFSFNGYVWFIAQTMSFAFCMAAIYYCLSDQLWHGHLALGLWACAVGCRPFQAVYFPVLAYLLYRKLKASGKDIFSGMAWLISPAVLAAFYMALNYARFGNPLQFGHDYLPEFQNAQYGQFSLHYVPENIKNLLLLPQVNKGKVMFPAFNGFAFYLATPIYISMLVYWVRHLFCCSNINKFAACLIPAFVAMHLLLLTFHRTMGGWHFGNRYTVDAVPFAFLSLMLLLGERHFKKLDMPLFILGLVLNAIGTVAVLNQWLK